MARYVSCAVAIIITGMLFGLVPDGIQSAHAVPCNNDCRYRQYFKKCGGGTTSGECLFYEQPTCARCVFNGMCDSTYGWWAWPCNISNTTTVYEGAEDECIHTCGCGTGLLITEGSVFGTYTRTFTVDRYECKPW